MKFYIAISRRIALAVRRRGTVAITIFALMLAVVMADTSQAQDASKGESSWDKADSVLVLPPVYQGDEKSEPADACAEDCPDSSNSGIAEDPAAVAGTADDPADASAGTADDPTAASAAEDGSTPDGSGLQEQQAAAVGGDQQSADGLDGSVGTAQDYQEQQEAAQELGNYGIVQVPAVIVGAPGGLYYLPGTSVPAASGFATAGTLPSSPAWMPQPMAKVAPLPSIVPRGFPPTMRGFTGGGFRGGFSGGFSHMSGFHGGFGHR